MCIITWHIWHFDTLTVPFFNQSKLCNYIFTSHCDCWSDLRFLHYMYIHELYPTHMLCKNLESILAASGSLALLAFLRQNVLQIKTVWRQRACSKWPRPRPHCMRPGLGHLLHARCLQEESHRFCPRRKTSTSRFTLYVAGPGTFNEGFQDAVVVNILLRRCNNAAAAVQHLHSVSIAHRGIKPHNFCHHLQCHSWEVKLIDSMSLTSHECDSLTLMQRRNFRSTCWVCSSSILRLI